MDSSESAPAVAALLALHTPSASAPASVAPPAEKLPPAWRSGDQTFTSLEQVFAAVRELHDVEDYVVAPHKSKYAARVIMVSQRLSVAQEQARSDGASFKQCWRMLIEARCLFY
jgi:hypothetical protein